jgi:hypothetical protein
MRLLEAGAAVHPELVEAALLAADRGDVLLLLQLQEAVRRRLADGVELAAAQRGDHRVGVVELAEDDAVDARLALPVARVRLERPELALLDAVEPIRARADAVARRVLADRVLVVLRPDVLRQDVDVHHRQLRIGDRGLQDDRLRVGRRRGDVRDRLGVVQPLLATGAVDRVGDVVEGQPLAVGPLEVRAQLVSPGALVGRGRPRRREARDRREVLRRLVGERRVLEVPELVRRHRDADGRVGAVEVLLEPDREGQRSPALLAGCVPFRRRSPRSPPRPPAGPAGSVAYRSRRALPSLRCARLSPRARAGASPIRSKRMGSRTT